MCIIDIVIIMAEGYTEIFGHQVPQIPVATIESKIAQGARGLYHLGMEGARIGAKIGEHVVNEWVDPTLGAIQRRLEGEERVQEVPMYEKEEETSIHDKPITEMSNEERNRWWQENPELKRKFGTYSPSVKSEYEELKDFIRDKIRVKKEEDELFAMIGEEISRTPTPQPPVKEYTTIPTQTDPIVINPQSQETQTRPQRPPPPKITTGIQTTPIESPPTVSKAIQTKANSIFNNTSMDYREREMLYSALVGAGAGLLIAKLFDDDD